MKPYPTDVTTSAPWRSAMSRSAPPPTRHPQLERALEELCGFMVTVEIREDGVLLSRLPQEKPLVTAGRIEENLVEILKGEAWS